MASGGPLLETTFWEDSCEEDAQEAARLGRGVARSLTVSFAAVSLQFTSSAHVMSCGNLHACKLSVAFQNPRASCFQHVNLMAIAEVMLHALEHFCWVRHPPSFLVTQASENDVVQYGSGSSPAGRPGRYRRRARAARCAISHLH